MLVVNDIGAEEMFALLIDERERRVGVAPPQFQLDVAISGSTAASYTLFSSVDNDQSTAVLCTKAIERLGTVLTLTTNDSTHKNNAVSFVSFQWSIQ